MAGDTSGPATLTRPKRALDLVLFRVFSSSTDAVLQRRPTDVLLLVGGVLGLATLAWYAPGPTPLDESISAVASTAPGTFTWLWQLLYSLMLVWVVYLVILPLAAKGRRRLLIDYVLAGLLAFAGAVGASLIAGTGWSATLEAFYGADPPPVYLAVRLAVLTAVVVTASPYMTRPLRRVGRAVIALGAFASIALGLAYPIGILAGLLVGMLAAAIAHLLRGSPGGLLTFDEIAVALSDIGVEVDSSGIAMTNVQIPGEQLVRARTAGGEQIVVKVYGRDAWDAQFVGSLWNSLTTRGENLQVTAGRRERVEHESFVVLLAERAGVPVLPLVASGESVEGDALLVTDGSAEPFTAIPAEQVDARMLAQAWATLSGLHAIGIAHRRIDGDRLVRRGDGSFALADFAQARTSAEQSDLLIDRARFLVTLALKVGPDMAIASAVKAIGLSALGEALPYVQPAVLTRELRRAVGACDWSLVELVASAVEATGDELPPMEQIRRVTSRSLLRFAVIALLVFWLLSLISGVDFAQVAQTLKSADLYWLLAALLLSPVIQAAFAFSTIGSTMTRLKYGPVLLLQYAIQFIAVVLPATAARLALEVRFFRKFGIAPGSAITMGVIDSVSGFVVQIGLIVFIVLSGLPGLTVHPNADSSSSDSTSTSSSSPLSPLALVAAIALVALVFSLAIPRRRARLKELATRGRAAVLGEMRNASSSLIVLRKPSKVGSMLGGNLGAQVIQAIVLGLCLNAFGDTADLSQLILINTGVSLFAGLMPVPGGVGVAEAGYTFGLEAIGVPSSIAISTALAFRLVTFYLPPIWGSISTRWLRKHEYI